jgi:intein/homing endonuclease
MDSLRNRKRVRIVEDPEETMEVDEEQPRKRGKRSTNARRRKNKEPEEDAMSEEEVEAAVSEEEADEGSASEEEYFEDDVDPLATVVVDGLVRKLTISKEQALEAVKEALKRKSILTDEYSRSRPADQLWKVGMDPNVVRRLEPKLIELREELEADRITIPKILTSELSMEHKKRALEWYDALHNMEPFTNEYINARDDLRAYMTQHAPRPVPVTEGMSPAEQKILTSEKEQRMAAEEKELLKTIGEFPDYRESILELNAPREAKARIYENWQGFKELKPGSEEYDTRKQWLRHALLLPYNELVKFVLPESPGAMNDLLLRVQQNLDRKVYGLHKVKQELLQVLAQRITNPFGSHPNLALVGPPGVGKCLAPDEQVIMYDGSLREAQDVKVGDLLMGDDSTPRTVLSTCSGIDPMYRIVPTKGLPFVVNEPHILSLVQCRSPRVKNEQVGNYRRYKVSWMDQGTQRSRSFKFSSSAAETARTAAETFATSVDTKGQVLDIALSDYLQKSKNWKSYYKGYRTGVEFPSRPVKLDPYAIGYWLGDGTSALSEITTADPEVVEYYRKTFPTLTLTPKKSCPITYYIGFGVKRYQSEHGNVFLHHLQGYNLINNKHIPADYLCNDRKTRLALLAGLLDSDGYLDNNCYEITQKSRRLAEQIRYLAQSLGFACYLTQVEKTCTNGLSGRVTGTYYKNLICGECLEEIPVLLERKKAQPRRQIKDANHFGFAVEPLGPGKYCGFSIDGNRRFLLKDFTVTHNTMIYSAVAEAYGIPFERVSLGGLHDPAVLKGHSSTYIGAEPGLIVKILQRIKCSNGMIFFDEMDKLGQTERGREVQYALLQILDATTNKDFRDTYLADITIDLSKFWFVVAMNHDEWLDHAVRDRLHIMRLKSYKRSEKEEIARQFLLPGALKEVGMPLDSVTFTPEAIKRLVSQMPEEGNVRPIKDEMALLIGRINLYRSLLLPDGGTGQLKLDFSIPNFSLPLTVTPELVDRLRCKKEEEEDDISKRMMYL